MASAPDQSSAAAVTLLACAELTGWSKLNVEIPFPRVPSVAELIDTMNRVFTYELQQHLRLLQNQSQNGHNAGSDGATFEVESVTVHDDTLVRWVDLSSSAQLHPFDQLYVFGKGIPAFAGPSTNLPPPRLSQVGTRSFFIPKKAPAARPSQQQQVTTAAHAPAGPVAADPRELERKRSELSAVERDLDAMTLRRRALEEELRNLDRQIDSRTQQYAALDTEIQEIQKNPCDVEQILLDKEVRIAHNRMLLQQEEQEYERTARQLEMRRQQQQQRVGTSRQSSGVPNAYISAKGVHFESQLQAAALSREERPPSGTRPIVQNSSPKANDAAVDVSPRTVRVTTIRLSPPTTPREREGRQADEEDKTTQAARDARSLLFPVYDRYFSSVLNDLKGRDRGGLKQLKRFLREHQHDLDEEQTTLVLESFERSYATMTYDNFCSFLLDGNLNSVLNPCEQSVWMSMHHPLHHYWIDSSHNTYLTGNQFTSDSSAEMYTSVLREGCRCVEIDAWDGDNDDPIVTHGMTRTSKIRFWDVIQAINKDAFTATPYPVILSLENHCCPKQCSVMATMLKKVFGDQLFSLSDLEADQHTTWTPARLQYKILVKWKIHRVDFKTQGTSAGHKKENYKQNENGEWIAGEDDPTPVSPGLKEGEDDDEEDELTKTTTDAREVKRLQVKELCDLVVNESVKTKDWGLSNKGYQVESVGERHMEKWVEKESENTKLVASRMLIRVYPGGWRVGSTNYNPQTFWQHGAQMIALNYQTSDLPMELNRALFRETNGSSGYILKPLALRDPAATTTVPDGPRFELKITIALGVDLVPKEGSEKVDPLVTLNLHGSEADQKRNNEQSTNSVKCNGHFFFWNETFTFTVSDPRTSFIHIVVKDKAFFGDTDLASRMLPLGSCRPGLRCIPLNSIGSRMTREENGKKQDASSGERIEKSSLNPTILCNFELSRIDPNNANDEGPAKDDGKGSKQEKKEQQISAPFGLVDDGWREMTTDPAPEAVRRLVLNKQGEGTKAGALNE